MKTIFLSSPYAIDYFADKNRSHYRHETDNVEISIRRGIFRTRLREHVRLANISTNGAAVVCTEYFPNNTTLHLALAFETNRKFVLKGKITRIQPEPASVPPKRGGRNLLSRLFGKHPRVFRYGIQFEQPPQEFADFLIKTGLRKKLSFNR
ncbi:MAG: PilZ domain-containing protein [Gammaproteobacteria bacterium]